MPTTETSQVVSQQFTDIFRKQIHVLLGKGYRKALPHIQPESKEEAITGFVAHAIQEILNTGNERWLRHYAVHNEKPISGQVQTGKSRRKLDLTIEHVSQRGRPEYVFEAKPLNQPKTYQRTANYIDEEGLQRFLQGEYALYTARFPEAGMLGYVHSDTPAQWRERLKKAIDEKADVLRLQAEQCDVEIIDEFPVEWCSVHNRDSSTSAITIYHVLLECCSHS